MFLKKMGQQDEWGHWNVFNEDEIHFSHKDRLILNEFLLPTQRGELQEKSCLNFEFVGIISDFSGYYTMIGGDGNNWKRYARAS